MGNERDMRDTLEAVKQDYMFALAAMEDRMRLAVAGGASYSKEKRHFDVESAPIRQMLDRIKWSLGERTEADDFREAVIHKIAYQMATNGQA